jgi:hypothetical protein
MSNDWLPRKDLCQRCFSGIDEDSKGNCTTCTKLSDDDAQWMKKTRFNLELASTAYTLGRYHTCKVCEHSNIPCNERKGDDD